MADFLTRLIERSRGESRPDTAAVRPLVAPLFAPEPGEAVPEIAVEATALEAPPNLAAPTSPAAPQPIAPPTQREVVVRRMTTKPVAAEAAVAKPSREVLSNAEVLPDEVLPARHDSEAPFGAFPVQLAPEIVAPQPEARRDNGRPEKAGPTFPSSTRGEIRLQEDAGPAPSDVQLSLRRGAKIEAAPTIRVTIGRVEVRAVLPKPPPAPPPRPTKTPPKLSLDEYLRGRR